MWVLLRPPRFDEPKMQAITTIGLDIAKSVFQVHGVAAEGNVVLRRQLKRRYVLAFFQKLPFCLVGIEACASSHHQSGARTHRAPAAATLSRLANRRRPAQLLRQLGEVHRRPPPRRASADLVAERSDAAMRPEWGRSGSARLALETTLMNRANLTEIINQGRLQ
jgi:transposase